MQGFGEIVPYTPIPTSHILNKARWEIFQRANDVLADVYTMLSSHQLARTNGGACNLSSTLVLLTILDAIAKHVYPIHPMVGRGSQRTRMVALIKDKLHWGPESMGWVRKTDAAEILYLEMRNTLTHELGKDAASAFRQQGFIEPTVGVWGAIPHQRIGRIDAMKSWPDKWPVLSVLTDEKGTRHKLTSAAFYWVVKDLVTKLAAKEP